MAFNAQIISNNEIRQVTIEINALETLLERAAVRGAQKAIEDMSCYNYKEACKRLGVCRNTLKKRIEAGEINPINGRISETEIRRYLSGKEQGKKKSAF